VYLRAVAVFLLSVSIVFLILSALFMIAVTVEWMIFKSLQTVGHDFQPKLSSFHSTNVTGSLSYM
jgi:hypothetical protein